jgi:nucleotide-binding universal stress UspA family protein
MIKNILVPTDYSDASRNALETAIAIAEKNNARLQLLQINDAANRSDEVTLISAKQICNAMAEAIKQKNGIQTDVLFAEGYIGPTIVKTAFEVKADLIVMGAYGASGYRDYFIGSNSYYAIKYASCPVLTVPEGKKWRDFNKVLFPVRPVLGRIKKFQLIHDLIGKNDNHCDLEIFGISIERKEHDARQVTEMARELNAKLRNAAINFAISYSNNRNVAEDVLEKADKVNADLIIISSTVDISNKQFFVGPFSQRIINHAKIPVLSVLRISES